MSPACKLFTRIIRTPYTIQHHTSLLRDCYEPCYSIEAPPTLNGGGGGGGGGNLAETKDTTGDTNTTA